MLTYEEARQRVIEVVRARRRWPSAERADLSQAFGRVLAEEIRADRDYPPFDRSTRDGFAVRAQDAGLLGAALELIGEIKAGDAFRGRIGPGQCAQIMTGAAVPAGADAVMMLEHTKTTKEHGKTCVAVERAAEPGQNIVPRGSEARAGQALLDPGMRLGYAELAVAAQVGHIHLTVFHRPRVAILSTGDEVVGAEDRPGPFQIRNSNGVSLATLATLAGAEPVQLGNSPDRADVLRAMIERGLEGDILVLSGGVSMGKYDMVEGVLRELGAEFSFDAVAIRPGRPAVFGVCREKFVFGLPGNPVSTVVTFELFVLPAIDLVGGAEPRPLPLFRAKLAAPVRQRAVLTHFLPARVSWEGGEASVSELPWQGSGDIVALAAANCFLVVPQTQLELAAGEWVNVLPRRGVF